MATKLLVARDARGIGILLLTSQGPRDLFDDWGRAEAFFWARTGEKVARAWEVNPNASMLGGPKRIANFAARAWLAAQASAVSVSDATFDEGLEDLEGDPPEIGAAFVGIELEAPGFLSFVFERTRSEALKNHLGLPIDFVHKFVNAEELVPEVLETRVGS